MHKTANVLDALPKRSQPEAKATLAAIYTVTTRTAALDAVAVFATRFAARSSPVARVTDELDTLLAFVDYPVEHHIHLCTTNPIESMRPRPDGAGSTPRISSPSSEPVPGSSVSYRNGSRRCPRTRLPSPRRLPPPDPGLIHNI